jgi:hypothetical protein
MEVQRHGFIWEKELLRIYGATPEELAGISYTSKMDLPAAFNRLDHVDVSIKTTCNASSVCMADCLRMFDAVQGALHLTVVHYKQDQDVKKVVSITEVDLTDSRSLLFGTLTREQLQELDRVVKSVPQKRKPTPEEHTAMYTLRDELQKLSGAIHLDIKCNSTQSRLQCSIHRFQHLDRIIYQSHTNEFRGGFISAELPSRRRVFKREPTKDWGVVN